MRSFRRLILRRAACLLTAVSLIPVMVLGPLGPGTILVHDHHGEDLHTHTFPLGFSGNDAFGYDHDHPSGSTIDLEGTRFVLTFLDLSRISAQVQVPGSQFKIPLSSDVVASVPPHDTTLFAVDLGAARHPVAALRAYDKIADLLMCGHALLI